MSATGSIALGVIGGAIRISTPFLFVSLDECLTEKSGRVNLGLEGTLVMGASSAYGISYLSGSPWLGVMTAAFAGVAFVGQALCHAHSADSEVEEALRDVATDVHCPLPVAGCLLPVACSVRRHTLASARSTERLLPTRGAA